MKSSERRMKLILLLQQSKNRLTVNDIADRFGVSRRTVFRDFNALSEMNVPVTWDEHKGYGVMPGYKVPPLMFTSKELATILVGINFVKSQVDRRLVEDAKGVELKIKEVLPDDLRNFMSSLEDRTIVDPYLNYGAEKSEGGNWYLIGSAISENKTITFRYRSQADEKISDRKVDPYLLVFFRDHWNVIGFSHKRSDFRNFVLDRMSDIKISAENFDPKADIDVEALIFGSDESKQFIEVLVAKSAFKRFRANLPANIFNYSEFSPNFFKAGFYFDNIDYINEWLLQFAGSVKIRKPVSLLEKRKELLESMIREMEK